MLLIFVKCKLHRYNKEMQCTYAYIESKTLDCYEHTRV